MVVKFDMTIKTPSLISLDPCSYQPKRNTFDSSSYSDTHVSTTPDGEFGAYVRQMFDALGQLCAGLRPEDTIGRQDLGVRPEILRLIFINWALLVKDIIGKMLAQIPASMVGVRLSDRRNN